MKDEDVISLALELGKKFETQQLQDAKDRRIKTSLVSSKNSHNLLHQQLRW